MNTYFFIDRLIAFGNISGSYLIVGPNGTDKSKIIEYFISKLLGEERNFFNFLVLKPQKKEIRKRIQGKNKKDKSKIKITENFNVETVREKIFNFIKTKNTKGSYKICLIEKAEQLNKGSQNALLKILEEPKEGLIFLLLIENEKELLPTVRSRSMKIFSKMVDPFLIFKEVQKNEILNEEDAKKIAFFAWGRDDLAKELLNNQKLLSFFETAFSFFSNFISSPLYKKIEILEHKETNLIRLKKELDCWLGFLLAFLEGAILPRFSTLAEKSKMDYNIRDICQLIDGLLKLKVKINKGGVNIRLALEDVFI